MKAFNRSILLFALGYALKEAYFKMNAQRNKNESPDALKKSELLAARTGSVVENGVKKAFGLIEAHFSR